MFFQFSTNLIIKPVKFEHTLQQLVEFGNELVKRFKDKTQVNGPESWNHDMIELNQY